MAAGDVTVVVDAHAELALEGEPLIDVADVVYDWPWDCGELDEVMLL